MAVVGTPAGSVTPSRDTGASGPAAPGSSGADPAPGLGSVAMNVAALVSTSTGVCTWPSSSDTLTTVAPSPCTAAATSARLAWSRQSISDARMYPDRGQQSCSARIALTAVV